MTTGPNMEDAKCESCGKPIDKYCCVAPFPDNPERYGIFHLECYDKLRGVTPCHTEEEAESFTVNVPDAGISSNDAEASETPKPQ